MITVRIISKPSSQDFFSFPLLCLLFLHNPHILLSSFLSFWKVSFVYFLYNLKLVKYWISFLFECSWQIMLYYFHVYNMVIQHLCTSLEVNCMNLTCQETLICFCIFGFFWMQKVQNKFLRSLVHCFSNVWFVW